MKIDDAIKSRFSSSMHRAIVNVRYTSNYLASSQNAFLSRFGLTMPQFNILHILRGAEESISVNTIKNRMVEKSPNTTRLMDKLIDKGLITRERCSDDRRIVFVKISEGGLKLLADIDEQFNEEEFIPKTLSEEEAQQLSALLDKLRG